MLVIGEAVIDDAIRKVSFCCDLTVCKGACCCIAGGRGAPLDDSEVREIYNALPVVTRYLTERSQRVITAAGPVEGRPGDYATTCIDEHECVFVYFDSEGIARCAFERAYEEGLTSWRKPLSCHLFPIRISRIGTEFLRYEEIDECAGARTRGRAENVPLFEFLKDPLIRRYGEAWYEDFRRACLLRSQSQG